MSTLRARCPDCRTLTAVAIGAEYQCHSCGREFAAGLVRVPRAWGDEGATTAAAVALPLPYPEAAVIEEDTVEEQIAAQIRNLPARPLILGGCRCAHVGAIRGLAARPGKLAVIWIDAPGDPATPGSSPPGNAGAMALRMVIEAEDVDPANVALVGTHHLDPARQAHPSADGVGEDIDRALAGCDRAYIAFHSDLAPPGKLVGLGPGPGGLTTGEAETLLRGIRARAPIAGLGLTGLRDDADPALLVRLAVAAGL